MSSQASHAAPKAVHEERVFRFDLERSREALHAALENGLGHRLTEVARGMWSATIEVDKYWQIEVLVRALPSERGTTIEIDVHHKSTGRALLWLPLLIPATIFIIPLFLMIASAQRTAEAQVKERRMMFHRMWTEVAASLGSPREKGYRGARARVAREPEVEEDEAWDEEFEDQDWLEESS